MINVESAKIEDIVEYGNNAKLHPDKQIDQIANSILEFGFNDPIAVDENMVIIEGHGRLLAARRLGLEEIPIIKLNHLSDAQKRAYIIAHNKLTMNTGFDMDLLAEEMRAIDAMDIDIELTGFTLEEIDDLEFLLEEDERHEDVDSDFIPDSRDNVVIRYGDIIELGSHIVMCGSATVESDVNKLMAGIGKADILITDPPYNVDYTGGTDEALKIQNDSMGDTEFLEFLTSAFTNASKVLKDGGSFYIWHADSEGLNFRMACKNAGLTVRQCLIWNKNSLVMGRQDYQWKHEPCLYGWKDGAAHLWNSDRKQTTVLDFDRPTRSDIHPTMKPVPLFEYCIKNNTKKGGVVLDMFLGSGTSIIAAEGIGRRCCGLELDPKYVQVIIDRWCEFTSIDRVVINGISVTWSEYVGANKAS